MGSYEDQNKWVKLCYYFVCIGYLFLLFVGLGWDANGAGGIATSLAGFFFYTAALVMITCYIFVDEANNKIVLIVAAIVAIIAGIVVLVQIFAVRAEYNSTKGFLSGASGIASGVMGILAVVMG